ncbi:MAG TPA: short chain dehydrogenase [Candidatus Acidoferrum sp.]|jgi:NAD(P)-dependent dehydrogenase (short-subunit alcohol dehydrogenase family)
MKIILIGASGTLGKAVAAELSQRHELIKVGRKTGDLQADMREIKSLRSVFQKTGKVDAIVCTAGSVHFGPWLELTPEKFDIGLRDKLMGQVNVVLAGQEFLTDGGSFTLTSGILSQDPIQYGAAASLVNGALESFVPAAAIELPRGLRINVVSPTVIQESMELFGPYFRGFKAIPASAAALAYSKSVEGKQTGQIYKV